MKINIEITDLEITWKGIIAIVIIVYLLLSGNIKSLVDIISQLY